MSPPSYNTPPIEEMILIKREAGPPSSDGYTPSEFSIPDSSTSSVVNVVSQISQKQSTMWEDIASSIKKLDPDHADVLLEAAATPTTSLPPVSTVVSGASDYYPPPPPQYNANFSESDIFSNTTRLSNR